MAFGFKASYVKRTNTIAWARARRLEKIRRLIHLVIGDAELIDIAINTKGEDEPMAYAILRIRKQSSLQTVLEYYNAHDSVIRSNTAPAKTITKSTVILRARPHGPG